MGLLRGPIHCIVSECGRKVTTRCPLTRQYIVRVQDIARGAIFVIREEDLDMPAWVVAIVIAAALSSSWNVRAQTKDVTRSVLSPNNPIVLVDSTGKAVARPLNESLVLVTVSVGVTAPALIQPIYGPDGREESALATWRAGGSALFTSPDCTAGAHVFVSSNAGLRASAQVRTPAGVMLYVGAVGAATTVAIHSILYDNGCAAVSVQQNGLVPVLATVNLDTAYTPPLSFQ